MNKALPSAKQCEKVSEVLKALAHPQRLMILCHLTDGAKTVGELENLSGASQSQVSQFLAKMKTQGLVKSEREAQFISYEIADKNIKKLIQALDHIFCR